MRMYVWTQSKPRRDGDLESGIVIHEYAHGISTRLTGGPANSGCLGFGESGGMVRFSGLMSVADVCRAKAGEISLRPCCACVPNTKTRSSLAWVNTRL
jgi:extracellular elastinolytic metalloproteinase